MDSARAIPKTKYDLISNDLIKVKKQFLGSENFNAFNLQNRYISIKKAIPVIG